MNTQRMKKLVTVLALVLAVCMLGCAAADTVITNPGSDVAVPVDVSSDDAAFAILTYQYDPNALQYQSTEFSAEPAYSGMVSGASDGRIAVAMLSGLTGTIGAIQFRVRDNASLGTYDVPFTASGVYNRDEEPAQMTAKTQTVLVESQINSFVRRCYSLILGRDPDQGGLDNWSNQLASGSANASQIISDFLGSQEFAAYNHNASDTVDILYNTMLNRPADQGGKDHWVEVMDGSGSNSVINGFCGSQEFLGICARYGIEAGSVNAGGQGGGSAAGTGLEGFVARCYAEALNRNADEGGSAYWCNILRNREQTPKQVANGFVYSPEMNAATKIQENPDALLDSLYRLYLGRPADEGGKAYWRQRIADGLSLEELNNGFADSQEFRGIVQSYGLE